MKSGHPIHRQAGRPRPLRIGAWVFAIAGALVPAASLSAEPGRRCGPSFLHFDAQDQKLIVLCEKSDTIVRMNPDTGVIEAEAPVAASPFALAAHPDGSRMYVSCRRGQEVVELDAPSLDVLRTFPLHGDPTGVAISADGRRLYAGVHSLDQVAVVDLATGVELKRLAAGNGPEALRLSRRRGRLYVTNLLSNPVPPDRPCQSEMTVIDDGKSRVIERVLMENANVGRGVAVTSDGSLAIVAISRPKNLVPMVQVARGWVVTNGFALWPIDGGAAPVQLLVDLPNRFFADPHDIELIPGDRKFYLSCAGVDTVLAVDLDRAREVMADVLAGRLKHASDDLGLSRRYVVARIQVGANPQALTSSADGRFVYAANRLDDTISVINTATDQVDRTWVIGEPPPADRRLRGERIFHSAARTFHGQFSCASCHPDHGFDGLQYDLEPDGLGENLLDNRSLRAVAGTGPFKWIGSNPDITTQCGTRTAKWITRTGWLSSVQVVELAAFIRSIEAAANPHRPRDGTLSAAQRRGLDLFERTTTNDGRPIPHRDRCNICHRAPTFTDGRKSDVGTKGKHDDGEFFDAAHLTGIFESAPYLHDGRAATLEEIWTRHNPDDRHGVSSDWTKRQLNDLVEYLKSL